MDWGLVWKTILHTLNLPLVHASGANECKDVQEDEFLLSTFPYTQGRTFLSPQLLSTFQRLQESGILFFK